MVTNHNDKPRAASGTRNSESFFGGIARSIARQISKILVVFITGTLAGAAVCLYYGFPLIFSLFGGVLVMAFILAILTSS
jgi:hypothetical protein